MSVMNKNKVLLCAFALVVALVALSATTADVINPPANPPLVPQAPHDNKPPNDLPKPLELYSLKGFLDRFADTKLAEKDFKNIASLQGDQPENRLVTPYQYAYLSLRLSQMCQNAEFVGPEGEKKEDDAALKKRREAFDSMFPNTVMYVIGNDLSKIDMKDLVKEAKSSQVGDFEEDSVAGIEFDSESSESGEGMHHEPSDKNADKKAPQNSFYYEILLTSHDAEKDLNKLDDQMKQFISEQEGVIYQRQLQSIQRQQRALERLRKVAARFGPQLQSKEQKEKFDAQIQKLAQEKDELLKNKDKKIKLDFKREVMFTKEELDNRFNNFNVLMNSICHDDKFRNADEKREVLQHAWLNFESKLLEHKQAELKQAIEQQAGRVEERRASFNKGIENKKSPGALPQPEKKPEKKPEV